MNTMDLIEYDRSFSIEYIAGMDEAGRGPLAGPVVCACCVMPLDEIIDGINDSKKISEKKRERLFELIKEKAIAYSVEIVDHTVIDDINILNATKLGMKSCIEKLNFQPRLILIDAVKLDGIDNQKSIIKGDASSYNIAAASILAKVMRDRLMRDYDLLYPEYGFAKHKGYGTKQHIDKIKEIGICPIHRKTFVKNFYYDK